MPTDVNQYKALSYSQLQPIQGYLIFQANKLQPAHGYNSRIEEQSMPSVPTENTPKKELKLCGLRLNI